ncbi:MAG: ATP-binding protein [Ginsengibacter sp.]
MEEIYPAIIAVSLVVIILSLGIVLAIVNYKRKQESYLREKKTMQEEFEKQLLQSQIEVQEATFSVLARELHDNVGQLLSSSKMLLAITQRNIADVPETLIIAEETIGKAINELRSLSKSLDKEWLEQFDLVENLSTEIKRINAGLILTIHFLHPDKLLLNAEKQIILFRIIQEVLQNAIKHAEAKNIEIKIESQPDNITVNIEDDGKGFIQTANDGLGIRNMKHRTKLLGGNITWNTKANGSSISIRLPFKENA